MKGAKKKQEVDRKMTRKKHYEKPIELITPPFVYKLMFNWTGFAYAMCIMDTFNDLISMCEKISRVQQSASSSASKPK